jgi:hypothetical protein
MRNRSQAKYQTSQFSPKNPSRMKHLKTKYPFALAAGILSSHAAIAGTETWFTPLTQSAPVVAAANALEERALPWVTPAGISQVNRISMREVEEQILSPLQSILRVNAGTSSTMFDMLSYDPSGGYLFIPHETPWGAGVSRYRVYDNFCEVIFAGDGQGESGNWTNDFGAFDPSRWTPNNTLLVGEEWTAEGRIIEILNPLAPAGEVQWRELNSIANVAHEGINFSLKFTDTIYFIDEWNSGSIYKFVMRTPGDYTVGQTFVLAVDQFLPSGGVPANDYNQGPNATAVREGLATWVPLTDVVGNPLPGITDPFRNGPTNDPRVSNDTRGGRPAADDAGGTPYGRPEDMAIARLANGNEVLYIAVTSENKVISIEILENAGQSGKSLGANLGAANGRPSGKAIVRTLVSNAGTPKNLGFASTTGVLNAPDNLALDALGNVYVIEDAPNGSSTGGDIWFVRDADNDGVAESLDHFMSIRVKGSEATGMIFNPANPLEFVVAVQHPDSTDLANVPNGLGDAVWMFNLTHVPNADFVKQLSEAEGFTNQ